MNLHDHARPQWSTWTCGPAALRCALLVYGDRIDGRRLARMANTTRDHGTDEDGLRAAAAEFDLRIRQETLQLPEDAAKRIREVLEEGKPILLCVDHYEHWLCALPRSRGVSLTNRHVWVADPARDGDKVVQRYTWRKLLRRLQWGLADESRFDLYIVEQV